MIVAQFYEYTNINWITMVSFMICEVYFYKNEINSGDQHALQLNLLLFYGVFQPDFYQIVCSLNVPP